MRGLSLLLSLMVAGGVSFTRLTQPAAAPADLVVVHARVYTVDETRPEAQAVAIRGDRIVVVGTDAEALALRGPATQVIDAGGRAVIPGLHDAHGHVLGLGQSLQEVDLRGTTSAQAVIDAVRVRAQQVPTGQWLRGRGWDQNDWADTAWPTAAQLDAATPDHPVYLSRVDGHAAWVNTAAVRAAGLTATVADPAGGRVIRGAGGAPAGVLVDTAMNLVARHIPPADVAARRAQLRLADDVAASLGLTTVHDAGVAWDDVAVYRAAADDGTLKTRLYVMLRPPRTGETLPPPVLDYASHLLTVRAVKLVADGALGSRGAALHEPYSDDPGTRGLLVTAPADLHTQALAAVRAGYQPCVHAIGDRANTAVLDLFEQLQREVPGSRALRMRDEHAQILRAGDIPRFAALDVIASVQTTHATSDMPWVEKRIGAARTRDGAYMWQALRRSGAHLANGSDFPVEEPNPMFGFYAAITRQDAQGQPPGGWMPDQRLTRAEALHSVSAGAAYAAHLEQELGMLRPGMLADLLVLSDDIMQVVPARVRDARPLVTIRGGRVTFRDGI
ncbi:N-substituted formamide deformylase precursor [Luteitalea pratensis]|uniref:N-substituted formamide deformylase n=1 Tax=Luteitalea pratensis TaxID=1855912 RepID=A0A143PTL6_LUTPR|nr:amidohydrolase [Luteitalea pratensis]AMY11508.1 N-substituted formamide deformylase precursor [Luteitalea pratensis]